MYTYINHLYVHFLYEYIFLVDVVNFTCFGTFEKFNMNNLCNYELRLDKYVYMNTNARFLAKKVMES